MIEILQVAGIIGIILFSLMRVFASNRENFFGYNLLYGAAIFGICVGFFEAPAGEGLIAALIATVVAHLLSLMTSSGSGASNNQNQSTGTTRNSTKKPAASQKPAANKKSANANQPKPQTKAPQKPKESQAAKAPQKPKESQAAKAPQKPKEPQATKAPPKPKTEPQVQKTPQKKSADKDDIKQTLHSCLRCGKRITNAVCGYCQYNNATGGIRMLCRVDPRKLQLRKPNSEQ